MNLQIISISTGFAVVDNDHGSLEHHDGGVERTEEKKTGS